MILVTGATGTIGSEVVRALHALDAPFRAAVHARPLDLDGVETVPIDFDRPEETLPAALDGVRVVFLASYATLHERAILALARDAGVERIVKLSAWRAGEEGFEIGRWHRAVERAIEECGIPWTFLRPNFFMQNFVLYVGEGIRQEQATYEPAGEAPVSYIDARDVGDVAARVLTESGHDGESYDLSGPEALTPSDVAETLTRALGRRIRHVQVSDEEYQERLRAFGFPEEDASAYCDAYRYGRTGALGAITPHVARLTGRAPTTFATFCQDHASSLAPSGPIPAAGLDGKLTDRLV